MTFHAFNEKTGYCIKCNAHIGNATGLRPCSRSKNSSDKTDERIHEKQTKTQDSPG